VAISVATESSEMIMGSPLNVNVHTAPNTAIKQCPPWPCCQEERGVWARVAMSSITTLTTKSFQPAYFEGVNWTLNKALSMGADILNLNGHLNDIVRQLCLCQWC
jgi:hypothetical protein